MYSLWLIHHNFICFLVNCFRNGLYVHKNSIRAVGAAKMLGISSSSTSGYDSTLSSRLIDSVIDWPMMTREVH